MLATPSLTHESFPIDDRVYRIFWAGELLPPTSGDDTPRINIWLKEVDHSGGEIPNGVIRQVTESVGAIPRLVIGSLWCNGSILRSSRRSNVTDEYFEIEAPSQWNIVRAGDHISSNSKARSVSHDWINPSDMPLVFQTSAGRRVFGHNARVISARTTTGREVIIPAYEIFRALYAGTSDLALALTQHTWNAIEDQFVVKGHRDITDTGEALSLDLAPGAVPASLPYLCLLRFKRSARSAANRIYPEIVSQWQHRNSAWITVIPPVTDQTFGLHARTVLLPSRDALLITQICAIDIPDKVAELKYSVAAKVIPVAGEGIDTPPVVDMPPSVSEPSSISKPRNSRISKRFSFLPSTAVHFLHLPAAKRTARTVRHVPVPGTRLGSESQPIRRQVSVGEPRSRTGPSRAKYTPDEEVIIEDRFAAVLALIETLCSDGVISHAHHYPIVRPSPPWAPTYCEFPAKTRKTEDKCPWSIIKWPNRRRRRALVLELEVEDRLVYWIETETTHRNRGNCSLAVEMVDGSSLDEGSLDFLLELCALNNGVWPRSIPTSDGTFVSARARHRKASNGEPAYRPSMMLAAFARLAKQKKILGTR